MSASIEIEGMELAQLLAGGPGLRAGPVALDGAGALDDAQGMAVAPSAAGGDPRR